MTMLTLDLDTKSKRVAYNKAHLLRSVFQKQVYIRKSSSGKGYHVKLYGLSLADYPLKLRLQLRKAFGDDIRRIIYDEYRAKRGLAIDVLFTIKDGKRSGEWELIQ